MTKRFVICKICEKTFQRLAIHLKYKHNMTIERYKEIFGDDVETFSSGLRTNISNAIITWWSNNENKQKMRLIFANRPPFSEERNKIISERLSGRTLTEEHKRRISKALEGNKNAEGCTFPGRVFSEEHKSNISRGLFKYYSTHEVSKETRNKLSHASSGENNWCWKGGISEKEYPKEFYEIREQIRERDNNTCQLCNKTKNKSYRNLDVHHIDGDKKNNQPCNLITLCQYCNLKLRDPIIEKKTSTPFNR